jgi:hypothetical protein
MTASSSTTLETSSSSSTSAAVVRKKGSRGRKAPYPNSILDRRVLQQALEDHGLIVKPIHIEGFYQALHRQHYPDLPTFVEQFEHYNLQASTKKENHPNNHSNTNTPQTLITTAPLKNAVSRRKNRNRIQLPQVFLDFLRNPNNGLVTVTSKVATAQTSADGSTTKLAVQLHDGQLVESVLMRYVSHDGSRASLCVSSQCGCAMGCTFCATGTMGLSGNLTTSEILEQVVHADRILAQEWESRKENQTDTTTRQLNLDLVRNVGKFVVCVVLRKKMSLYTRVGLSLPRFCCCCYICWSSLTVFVFLLSSHDGYGRTFG